MRLRSADNSAGLELVKQDFILKKTDEVVKSCSLVDTLAKALRMINSQITKLLAVNTRIEYLGKSIRAF